MRILLEPTRPPLRASAKSSPCQLHFGASVEQSPYPPPEDQRMGSQKEQATPAFSLRVLLLLRRGWDAGHLMFVGTGPLWVEQYK